MPHEAEPRLSAEQKTWSGGQAAKPRLAGQQGQALWGQSPGQTPAKAKQALTKRPPGSYCCKGDFGVSPNNPSDEGHFITLLFPAAQLEKCQVRFCPASAQAHSMGTAWQDLQC